MGFMDQINDYMENLQAAAARYAAYREVKPSQLDYHDPENELQEKLTKSTDTSMFVIAAVGGFFVLAGLLGIFGGNPVAGIIIGAIGLAVLGFFFFITKSKAQVIEGRAAYKQIRYSRRNGNHRSETYCVTVAFESPEKMVVPLIQTTHSDYNKIEEGTPVLLIKRGAIYQVRAYMDV